LSELENSRSVSPFDFEGLDQDRVGFHPTHGAYVQANPFITWLGFSNPSKTIKDNLQEGDYVKGLTLVTPSGRQRGTILTKRGVRRLLFRSNTPLAVKYADSVLDMLDELDRSGMVVAPNITDEQLGSAQERLSEIAKRRLEERMDYKQILHALKLGEAISDEYRYVQNTLYMALFGMTAEVIRTRQPQRTGTPRKRGEGFRKSTVAKDFLTEEQLGLLSRVVLATYVQIQQHYPNGTTAAQMVDAINRAVAFLGVDKRRRVAA
jgi:prophage antirepressor-like protein